MNKAVFNKILKYLGRFKGMLFLTVLLSAVTVLLTLYVPIIIGDAIDLIVGSGNVDLSGVGKLLIKAMIVVGITALIQWVCSMINNRITYGTVKDIREAAFTKIQKLPLSYLDTHPTGETVSRIISDTDQFADGLLMGFTQLFSGIITIIVTLVIMLVLNWKIALAVVVLTPISLIVASFIAKRTYSMFKKQSETRGEQTAYVDEMVGGLKVVKAFSYSHNVIEKFEEMNDRLEKHSLKAIFFSSLTNPTTRFVNSLVYATVALLGALLVPTSALTVGGLTVFLNYASQYAKPFNEISGVIAEMQNALACASRVFELIEEEPQSPDGDTNMGMADGNVEIKNVSFSYVPEKKLIQNLSLDAKKGMRVAIVGPTGCGKTTLINLLMRFYDVNSGEISVDGVNINNMTRHSLRVNSVMVLQETW
ncbi:MAG: ABC transporter ATP-binding protein, partial [Clostridia bacterium]|nr:ABC transporter ATP-binding protein [Clostridia bacterium]